MGTPDFAVPTLRALHNSSYHVSLVVTQPDRPKGRGRKLIPPPVKEAAMELGYETIQPESVKTDAFFNRVQSMEPDFFVVIALGHILPKNILEIPTIAAVNVHASLLPKYRGAAPIQWAIINREQVTGVTTMLMAQGLDAGDMLLSSTTSIGPGDTAQHLHDRLSEMGAPLLLRTLDDLVCGKSAPQAQDPSQVSYAPMLTKKDGQLDWFKPARELEALIRGVTPWPGAFTFHGKKRIKIFKSEIVPVATYDTPGRILKGFTDELRVATGRGILSILELQGESGKRLPVKDFLRGYRFEPRAILT
jgi:methionyl-tRNA formyltransferase